MTLPAFIGPNADLDPCLGKTPLDGACEPYLDRWTFDLGAKVCRPYKTSYNSGGIVNSFLSQRDCQTTCHVHIPQERRCSAKLEIGQDITVVPDRCMPPKRFRFNEATARCEDFSRFGKQTSKLDTSPSSKTFVLIFFPRKFQTTNQRSSFCLCIDFN